MIITCIILSLICAVAALTISVVWLSRTIYEAITNWIDRKLAERRYKKRKI